MSNRGDLQLEYIISDKDTHFTGGLNTNAMEVESLSFPTDWVTLANVGEILIEGIAIESDQNLDWDVVLFSKSTNVNADLDLDSFIDYVAFANTTGKQIAGAGQFYYASPLTVPIPYKLDTAGDSALHVGLVNRNVTAKNAGASGEVKLIFSVRPHRGV